jgi:5'-nucleotidase
MVRAFLIPIAAVKDKVIGRTTAEIARGESQAMANLIADAQLAATRHLGSVAAFINAGGVRAPIDEGDVTYGEALSVQPFGNTLVVMELTGAELHAVLARGGGGRLHPSAGTSYSVRGDTVSEVVIAGEPLVPGKVYKVTLNNFTAGGGDNHLELKGALGTRTDTGIVDVDALIEFIGKHSPLAPLSEARIKQVVLAKAA